MTSVGFWGRFVGLGPVDAWLPLPGAPMGGDALLLNIARHLVVVGFDGDGGAQEPRRPGVRVAITGHGDIAVALRQGLVTAIG